MTEQTIVCITCPRGCTMNVTQDGEEITVTGNSCNRGEAVAVSEPTNPTRTNCTTVATAFPESPVLPCRVSAEIPKDKIFDLMKEINNVVVTERIGRGDVILNDVLGTGVDVIATSDLLKK